MKFHNYLVFDGYSVLLNVHSKKNSGLFQPKFGSNIDKPSKWVNILNDIFNPKFEFAHILPKIGLKQPSIFLECMLLCYMCAL